MTQTSKTTSEVKVYTDGGARGNPGPAALGVAFVDQDGKVIAEFSEHIGVQTNNFAEYSALLFALEKAKKMNLKRLDCYLDSELVVKQLAGTYRVKHKNIRELYEKVRKLACDFEWIRFSHVERSKNKLADSLVNRALDQAEEL